MQKTCIVIPCYNEATRLPVKAFIDFYNETSESLFFCFVNDGSSDNTSAVLEELSKERNRVIVSDNPQNAGKAEAIRSAVLRLHNNYSFDYIAYFDADFATPLSEIFLLQKAAVQNPELKIAFGSRVKRIGAHIHRSAQRHYLGRVFSTIASLILRLPVYDTQCGAKLFHTSVSEILFKDAFCSKWLFDIELFARMVKHYGREEAIQKMTEVPLNHWSEVGESKLGIKSLIRVPWELWQIYRLYKDDLKKS